MNNKLQQAKNIFSQAIESVAEPKWSEFVHETCAGDSELRSEVEKLLQAHQDSFSLVDKKRDQEDRDDLTTAWPGSGELIGQYIGPYKLLQQIGEGGMGIVFMAEQTQPVTRRVALKIIKPGMDSQAVLARFEAERQALAMMDHPNIARVLDAGMFQSSDHAPRDQAPSTTADGRAERDRHILGRGLPYFVMELVKGIPITTFCDRQHLTTRQRLELFLPVCQAIQHAHQKGVIHRDVKPSNVLIASYDGKPVPKIIDFGVAKAIGQKLTEKTMFTQFGQVVGTIEYMSPEQAEFNQLDIDTRSDVYSLGVLLYELLTGNTPFDKQRLRSVAFDELLRIIREEEPPSPSLRLSSCATLATIADNRKSEPKRLTALVRGDLDWIVMKALEKDRIRRYETASSLAADVQRFLDDEPVEARKPSAAYRLKKYVRRNQGPVIAASLVFLVLTAGLTASLILFARSERLRHEAVVAKNDTQKKSSQLADALRDVTAERNKVTEERNQKTAALAEKETARRRSESLRLAAHAAAVRGENPALSLLLAIEATKHGERHGQINNALVAAISNCNEIRTLHHPRQVVSCDYSGDGSRVVTGCTDGVARVWDVASGQVVTTVGRSGLPRVTARFSPDGNRIATIYQGFVAHRVQSADLQEVREIAFSDRVVRLWDAASGKELVILRHDKRVTSIQFSRDGQQILTASWNGKAKLWDVLSGQALKVFDAGEITLGGDLQPMALLSAAFSPDEKRVLLVAEGKRRMKADLTTAKFVAEPDAPIEAFDTKSTSPRSFVNTERFWAPTNIDVLGQVWDVNSGKQLLTLKRRTPLIRSFGIRDPLGFERPIFGCFAGDGEQIVIVERKKLHQFHAESGSQKAISLGDRQAVQASASPQGRHLLIQSVGRDFEEVFGARAMAKYLLWDLEAFQQIDSFDAIQNNFWDAQFSPDGKRFVISANRGNSLSVSSTSTRREICDLLGHEQQALSACFNPRGDHVVTTSGDSTARIWRVGDLESYGRLIVRDDSRHYFRAEPNTQGTSLLLHDTDSRFAQMPNFGESKVTLYSMKGGQSQIQLEFPLPLPKHPRSEMALGHVVTADIDPTSRRVVTVSDDRKGTLYRSLISELLGRRGPGTEIPYTPVRIWNAEDGKLVHALEGHEWGVTFAQFSSDGNKLLTIESQRVGRFEDRIFSGRDVESKEPGTAGKTSARIWNTEIGELITSMDHVGRINCAVLSPNSELAFSADNTVGVVWSTDTGKVHKQIAWNNLASPGSPHLDQVRPAQQAQFTPSGDHLVTRNGVPAIIWDTQTLKPISSLDGLISAASSNSPGPAAPLVCSPDSRRVLVSDHEGTDVHVYELPSGKMLGKLAGHRLSVTSAHFSRDGRWVVTASEDGTARIWDIQTLTESVQFKHKSAVASAMFTSDGQFIVTAAGGEVQLWPVDPLPEAMKRKPRDLTPSERARFAIDPSD